MSDVDENWLVRKHDNGDVDYCLHVSADTASEAMQCIFDLMLTEIDTSPVFIRAMPTAQRDPDTMKVHSTVKFTVLNSFTGDDEPLGLLREKESPSASRH